MKLLSAKFYHDEDPKTITIILDDVFVLIVLQLKAPDYRSSEQNFILMKNNTPSLLSLVGGLGANLGFQLISESTISVGGLFRLFEVRWV